MKAVVLLVVSLIAIAAAYNDNCMAKTSYVCSITQPTDSVFWSYCPSNALWTKLPCGKYIEKTILIQYRSIKRLY